MPISGIYTYKSSRNDVITGAFRKIGRLGDFESITDSINAGKLAAGIAALQPLVKAFANKGMPLWAIDQVDVGLSNFAVGVAGIDPVTIGPTGTLVLSYKPLKLIQAIRRDRVVLLNPQDTELTIITGQAYGNFSSKTSEGGPTQIWYSPQGYVGNINIWPLPDTYWQTNGSLILRFHRPFADMSSVGDDFDFPSEFHEALIYSLAIRLAPDYGVSLPERQQLKAEAKEIVDDALSFMTEEGSLFIYPDNR